METYEVVCTCDDPGDDPCPAHRRENALQDDLSRARAREGRLLEWTRTFGEHLSPRTGSSATYGAGVRWAKREVARLLTGDRPVDDAGVVPVDDLRELLLYAVRYGLSRNSYVVLSITRMLKQYARFLSVRDLLWLSSDIDVGAAAMEYPDDAAWRSLSTFLTGVAANKEESS